MTDFHGVRFGRPDEIDKLYDFLLLLHEENGMFSVDEKKARATLGDLLTPPRGFVGIIDGDNGQPEAAVALYVTTWWYTNEPHITEFFTFVKKEARRSTHARRLIDFAKWVADGLEMPLHIGIISTHRSEAKQKLYRRMLPQVGAYYLYRGDRTRLGTELPSEPATNEAEQLLDELRGAAKRVVTMQEPGKTEINGRKRYRHSQKARERAENTRKAALAELRNVVEKTDAVLNT